MHRVPTTWEIHQNVYTLEMKIKSKQKTLEYHLLGYDIKLGVAAAELHFKYVGHIHSSELP